MMPLKLQNKKMKLINIILKKSKNFQYNIFEIVLLKVKTTK